MRLHTIDARYHLRGKERLVIAECAMKHGIRPAS